MTDRAVVLDASAMLAMLNREPGGEVVAAALAVAVISAVNWSEVLQKSAEVGISTLDLDDELRALGAEIMPFDAHAAVAAAEMWSSGARKVSFADRACLATARLTALPAVTADRAWADLDVGVQVELIR